MNCNQFKNLISGNKTQDTFSIPLHHARTIVIEATGCWVLGEVGVCGGGGGMKGRAFTGMRDGIVACPVLQLINNMPLI